MVAYSLGHLTQADDENVVGPIQDTEALLLFAVVRGMRMRRVLEIGGLSGYSARNFLEALDPRQTGQAVYTVDLNPMEHPPQDPRHRMITKDARDLVPEDVDHEPLDLVFFDCHEYEVQMTLFDRLESHGLIAPWTVLALHDTNVHPFRAVPWAYDIGTGWVHQRVEREMVNEFARRGYHAFSLHTPTDRHDQHFPFRHGVTLMQRFAPLATERAEEVV